MKWIECSDRMDQYVIKKDGTAVDTEYFMATHVPFRDLEFVEFGDMESDSVHLSEEQIYEQYIVNKADKHQMLIVRGTHGSGKSHLICWLHNRFVSDPVNYNPDTEKVVFLRRLRNTVRGAVQQMLDEGIVCDEELKEKFERFTNSSDSQSEEEFKATIYSEYAKKVQIDSSGDFFKPIICKNIAAFLYDSRVQDYMMRPDGPVNRCYQRITSGATSVLTDDIDVIFSEKDFVFPKDIARSIQKGAAEEVRDFYLNELREDEKLMKKLADYLNHFTSGVIQSCANITSENARDLFVNLRKSLHKEGKKLTIFIEDFTSFSIVESELITALSVENGGNYNDLCRVTSVIGITDGYYGSFRDNFKTRVTKQIKVTEQSYGGDEFLLEMTARYLNAIYSPYGIVKNWYHGQAVSDSLPEADFKPSYEWDSVQIGERKYTLYPFNRKAILSLYDQLKVKTTRNFLTYVIQYLFVRFADGMEYNDEWHFPELPQSYIDNRTLQPPYADSVESSPLSDGDKQRLKLLLKIWGDETTESDEKSIGGISRAFLNEIGLGHFAGIGKAPSDSDNNTDAITKSQDNTSTVLTSVPENQPISKKDATFRRHQQDIESWFEEKKILEYSSDYNKWLGEFVIQAIPWQDEGLPGYFAKQRQISGNFVDIEDSKLDTNREKAVVVMERNSESRTLLMGLTLFDYYRNWSFDNAAYYQFTLINWIEKNKQLFINKIFSNTVGLDEHPVLTWALAVEYLQRCLFGEKLCGLADDELLIKLVQTQPNSTYNSRLNKSWNSVVTFLNNQSAQRVAIHDTLSNGSRTIMGIVGDGEGGKVPFYRTKDLLNSISHLKRKNWDIRDEMEEYHSPQHSNIREFLSLLYSKIDVVLNEEKLLAESCLKRFRDLVGENPTEEDYLDIVEAIKQFYTNCEAAHEFYKTDLKQKFEDEPQEQAKRAVRQYFKIQNAVQKFNMIDLLSFFASGTIDRFSAIIEDLEAVEKLAIAMENKHKGLLGESGLAVDQIVVDAALSKLEELSDRIEALEVIE